ncbi:MAG: nickel-responsive transcriptional regulator NikR [Desulfovibrionaceae bacterium]|nr:nickel-responsive transcriptional regulator NikR [Desulfovibrionaceae bacterium]
MAQTIRFGISLDDELLEQFDALCEKRGSSNRSEAIRDLIRAALVEDRWEHERALVAGTLTMVFEHHKSDLAQRLTEEQHEYHDLIITTLHVHLDHDNCLEVLVLKGEARHLRALANKLLSIKGVKTGQLVISTTGEDLP